MYKNLKIEDIINEKNDLSFLKDLLTIEKTKLKSKITSLMKFSEVQNYLELKQKIASLKLKNYQDPTKTEIEEKIELLSTLFKEISAYEEASQILEEYKKYSKKLDTLTITKEGIVYNAKSKKNTKTYTVKELLDNLMILKNKNNLPLQIYYQELANYRNIVLTKLTSFTHYQDDTVVEDFLGTIKIYENPKNYTVESLDYGLEKIKTNPNYNFTNNKIILIGTIPLRTTLSKRETAAFQAEEALKFLDVSKNVKTKQKGPKKYE